MIQRLRRKPILDYQTWAIFRVPTVPPVAQLPYPTLADKQVKTLSGDFHAILVQAKLVKPRNYKNYKADGKRREYSGLSFHCLRHNTTSALKNTGSSAAIAYDIVGHDSEAMSRNYTKIDSKIKKEALDRLPDILPS